MKFRVLRAIVSGWTNFIFESDTHRELANVRASICSECPHANPEYKFKQFIPEALEKSERLKEIIGLGCDKCGCLISAKIRQHLEACPLDKW